MPETGLYHGGIPGKRPGDIIYPAADLGFDYTSAYEHSPGLRAMTKPKYRPDLVYCTTHLGSARGYAARYVNEDGDEIPGDVYAVAPQGQLEPDPDFNHPKIGAVYTASAHPLTITAVVDRAVVLDRRQQNKECWPYRYYGLWEETHAADGTVLVSEEMRALGVTDDYVALLPKWMDLSEYSNDGALWKPGLPGWHASADEVLEILVDVGLDTGMHTITNEHLKRAPFVDVDAPKTPVVFGPFVCQECGAQFGTASERLSKQNILDAAVHQAGDRLPVIAEFNGGLNGYVHAMRRRSPDRWMWLTLP